MLSGPGRRDYKAELRPAAFAREKVTLDVDPTPASTGYRAGSLYDNSKSGIRVVLKVLTTDVRSGKKLRGNQVLSVHQEDTALQQNTLQ